MLQQRWVYLEELLLILGERQVDALTSLSRWYSFLPTVSLFPVAQWFVSITQHEAARGAVRVSLVGKMSRRIIIARITLVTVSMRLVPRHTFSASYSWDSSVDNSKGATGQGSLLVCQGRKTVREQSGRAEKRVGAHQGAGARVPQCGPVSLLFSHVREAGALTVILKKGKQACPAD